MVNQATKLKKLVKPILFTDLHWGRKNNSEQHLSDCNKFIDWVISEIQTDKTIDSICFLGDWFENRNAINIATFNAAHQAVKRLNNLGLPIFFIVGNHDLYYRHSRELTSLVSYDEFENVTLVNQPILVENMGNGVVFSPYLFHNEYPDIKEKFAGKADVWMGHFEFKGFMVTGYGMEMPTGPEHKDFADIKRIFSGHFHKRQVKDNVAYIGSCFSYDFSDTNDLNRGICVYEFKKDKLNFKAWPEQPSYYKLFLSELLDESQTNNKTVNLNSYSRVRCVVDTDITFEESIQLKDVFMKQFNLREFTMEENLDKKTAIADTEYEHEYNDKEDLSINQLITKMLNEIKTDTIDNNKLVEIYKSLQIAN